MISLTVIQTLLLGFVFSIEAQLLKHDAPVTSAYLLIVFVAVIFLSPLLIQRSYSG